MSRAQDKHALYLRAVQSPVMDVETLGRVYRRLRGRDAVSLREDFAGSAAISAAWVESDDEREAHAVDLDAALFRWAERHVLSELDEDERERVTLACADVRVPSARSFDLILAPNFSWALFDDADLIAYLEAATRSLDEGGVLALEVFGGAALRGELVHRHRLPGFTYVWEQRRFDAEREVLDASIHFECDDGSILRDAFRYSFRLRGREAMTSLFARAGLAGPRLFVVDARGRAREAAKDPARDVWNGYWVATPAGC